MKPVSLLRTISKRLKVKKLDILLISCICHQQPIILRVLTFALVLVQVVPWPVYLLQVLVVCMRKLPMGEEIKLTDGLISATTGYKGSETMYQISAAVQPGNSGGPLFNSDGAVIGIVCAKHEGAENANYAVKVSYLYNLINSSNLGIDISGNDKVKSKKLSKKVKKLRNYVYLIECSTR
jgi:hypothetical protein